jgi:hypothetical protein
MTGRQLLIELTKATMLCTADFIQWPNGNPNGIFSGITRHIWWSEVSSTLTLYSIKSVQCRGSNTTEFPLQSHLQGVTICTNLHLTLTPCNVYLPPVTPVLCPPDSS